MEARKAALKESPGKTRSRKSIATAGAATKVSAKAVREQNELR